MKTRILVAAIALPLLLVVVLVLPSVGTAILVAAMSILAAYELMIGAGSVKHIRIFAYSALAAMLVCVWSWLGMPRAFGMLGIILYLCALFGEMLAAHTELKLRTICVAIFAVHARRVDSAADFPQRPLLHPDSLPAYDDPGYRCLFYRDVFWEAQALPCDQSQQDR